MRKSSLAALCLIAVALSACGEAGQTLTDMKDAAVNAGAQVAKAASEAVDTKTACTLAGQNEAFCGCLQTELGAKVDPKTIDALASVVKDSITGGGVEKTASSAPGIDQKTKDALVKCGVQGAVGAATESGQ